MSAIGDLLGKGGGIGEQLFVWGVLQGIITGALGPYMRELEYLVNEHDPNLVLSPEILADMVERKILTESDAAAVAKKSGIGATDFHDLVHAAGEPPGLETVLQLYRRGVVDWGEAGPTKATVANAIATSRIYTYWSDALKHLNVVPIPAAEMVDAMVEGQTTRGTRTAANAAASGGSTSGITPDATTFYEAMIANGFTPDQADLMFNTRGNPPSPTQLLDLFRRGLIQWTGTGPTETTVQQGIYEGATKDKWEPIYKGLVQRIPSEYYILQMLKTGDISATAAAHLLTIDGYTTQVVQGIVHVGSKSQTTTYKKLTESLVTKLYKDKVISRTDAKTALKDLGFSTTSATFVLTVSDMTLQVKQTDSAVTRIRSLYVARKMAVSAVKSALTALGVNAQAATQLLQTWSLERTASVKLLTETQIVDAWEYTILTQTQALYELVALGYTPYDAWTVLSIKNKAPLPNEPPRTTTATSSGIT